jgi:hypothetical protein
LRGQGEKQVLTRQRVNSVVYLRGLDLFGGFGRYRVRDESVIGIFRVPDAVVDVIPDIKVSSSCYENPHIKSNWKGRSITLPS